MVRLQTISVACNVDSTYGGETVRGRFLGFARNDGKGRDLSDVRRRVFCDPLSCQIPACGWLLMASFRLATHLLNGDGQARKALCFFLRFEGCPLAFGEWGLGMDLRL